MFADAPRCLGGFELSPPGRAAFWATSATRGSLGFILPAETTAFALSDAQGKIGIVGEVSSAIGGALAGVLFGRRSAYATPARSSQFGG